MVITKSNTSIFSRHNILKSICGSLTSASCLQRPAQQCNYRNFTPLRVSTNEWKFCHRGYIFISDCLIVCPFVSKITTKVTWIFMKLSVAGIATDNLLSPWVTYLHTFWQHVATWQCILWCWFCFTIIKKQVPSLNKITGKNNRVYRLLICVLQADHRVVSLDALDSLGFMERDSGNLMKRSSLGYDHFVV